MSKTIIDTPNLQTVVNQSENSRKTRSNRLKPYLRRVWGELVGTYVIVFAAGGSAVADSLSGGGLGLVGAAFAAGLGVMVMIYALGHICNAHFNPAVTLAFTLVRHFPVREVPGYLLAQFSGAILAAATLRLTYGNLNKVGANAPGPGQTAFSALVMEIILSFMLMFVIMAVATDTRAVGQAAALAIGMTVVADILIGGPVSGASMNPARSFGPALLSGQWQDHWLYWLGPTTGTSLGAFVYQLLRGEQPAQP